VEPVKRLGLRWLNKALKNIWKEGKDLERSKEKSVISTKIEEIGDESAMGP
jgi:hypothetical protein